MTTAMIDSSTGTIFSKYVEFWGMRELGRGFLCFEYSSFSGTMILLIGSAFIILGCLAVMSSEVYIGFAAFK
jgi:hypothetical protein